MDSSPKECRSSSSPRRSVVSLDMDHYPSDNNPDDYDSAQETNSQFSSREYQEKYDWRSTDGMEDDEEFDV